MPCPCSRPRARVRRTRRSSVPCNSGSGSWVAIRPKIGDLGRMSTGGPSGILPRMVSLDLFRRGDVYLDYPFEDMRFRFDQASNKVYVRWENRKEVEIPQS